MKARLISLIALSASASAACAQELVTLSHQEGPAYTIVRYDEDYSYLKDAPMTDLFDSIKYIPLGENSYVSLGGQARYRYEYFNNSNFNAKPQDEDGYHLQRYYADVDIHLSPYFRVFAMGKSSMEDGRDGGPRATDADEVDIQDLFADAMLPIGDQSKLTFRFGRQELFYGNQRLIAPSDWSNVRRTFEGAKVSLETKDNTLDVFWVRPVTVDKERLNNGSQNQSFAGVYDTLKLPWLLEGAKTQMEAYGLVLDRTKSAAFAADSDTYTVGARVETKPKPWDFEGEADEQFGQYASDSIEAYSLAVKGGYTFENVETTPRVFVGFDIASGSKNPANRFNQLFPSTHNFFGYIDVIARENIMDLHPGVTFELLKNLSLRAEDHFFWRENENDGVYAAQGGLLRAAGGKAASDIGNEIDLLLNWQVDRHLLAYFGYSHFFTGEFIKQTGSGRDIDFVYAAAVYTF